MSPKPTDPVPAYEELFEQRPENTRTGYSQIPTTDPDPTPNSRVDLENQLHTHQHSDQTQYSASEPDPPNRDHFHCETCDLQRERRERREAELRTCKIVSRTFVAFGVMFTVICILGLPALATFLHKKKESDD
ncbi:uncharacterized protein N7469_006911 [Penicillium citrinum]|uniref:Uncharacterized protein n=1 Tax=Penicillium citrinum TaxID=5077 RepID=A0A9W9NVD1_PENCI|nr:uncharacterized protein N7469_006911 [Penicillium citrinum]KAJ5226905.1 hypothetical protein N7469_006911 [Penicillium citrinum]